MAENLETPSFGNFSIENTIEMGMGSADLLNDLMSPETATSTPDDIQEIKNDPAPEKKACCKAKASTTADHADCKDKKDGEVKACCKGKTADEHANCKDSKSES